MITPAQASLHSLFVRSFLLHSPLPCASSLPTGNRFLRLMWSLLYISLKSCVYLHIVSCSIFAASWVLRVCAPFPLLVALHLLCIQGTLPARSSCLKEDSLPPEVNTSLSISVQTLAPVACAHPVCLLPSPASFHPYHMWLMPLSNTEKDPDTQGHLVVV